MKDPSILRIGACVTTFLWCSSVLFALPTGDVLFSDLCSRVGFLVFSCSNPSPRVARYRSKYFRGVVSTVFNVGLGHLVSRGGPTSGVIFRLVSGIMVLLVVKFNVAIVNTMYFVPLVWFFLSDSIGAAGTSRHLTTGLQECKGVFRFRLLGGFTYSRIVAFTMMGLSTGAPWVPVPVSAFAAASVLFFTVCL